MCPEYNPPYIFSHVVFYMFANPPPQPVHMSMTLQCAWGCIFVIHFLGYIYIWQVDFAMSKPTWNGDLLMLWDDLHLEIDACKNTSLLSTYLYTYSWETNLKL